MATSRKPRKPQAKEHQPEPGMPKERKASFSTVSGLPVDRVYTSQNLGDGKNGPGADEPGEYPFSRGIHPTGYRGRLWTMRMFAGFGTAEDTNQRFKYLLDQGQTGLSVAFDMPTLYGYDTDDPLAKASSASAASPSHLSRTWKCCSTAYLWTRSPRR